MKLQEIKEIRDGMSWGTAEQGIEQLNEREIFLLDIIGKYEKALNDIVNPQMDEWYRYNEKHGGEISFQEFLKDIARNGLMKE